MMYPRANPTPERQIEAMTRTGNNDLSLATNVRRKNAGYVIKHRTVRIAIREKLGPPTPRNNGFDLGRLDFKSRDSPAHWKSAVDGGWEYQGGYSASEFLLLRVESEESA